MGIEATRGRTSGGVAAHTGAVAQYKGATSVKVMRPRGSST
jgi:hypothetical protein